METKVLQYGYEKIPDTTKNWILNNEIEKKIKTTKWVVTEKIHGANLCIIYDILEENILFSKRREIIKDNESFFGHENLQIDINILKIIFSFVSTKISNQNWNQLLLYGEICGGVYPHPNVEINNNVKLIQTGIYYSPNIEFISFDIALINNKKEKIYIDYEISIEAFKLTRLLYAKELFIGNFEDAINYKIKFQSTIPNLFNLPEIKDNIAEGIIIKPLKNIIIDTKKGKNRAIIKRKIDEFNESDYNKAEKWIESINNHEKNNNINILLYEINALVTYNRLNNAISKIGIPTKTNINKISKILLEEIKNDVKINIEDYHKELWEKLSSNQKKDIDQEILKLCKQEIINYYKNHILI